MFFNNRRFARPHLGLGTQPKKLGFCLASGGLQVNHGLGDVKLGALADSQLQMLLHDNRHAPRLKQPRIRHAAHVRQPAAHEMAMRIMVVRLFDGVVNARGVDASRTGLHLHLAPMDTRLVVQKLSRQPLPHGSPMQPQRISGDRHQHGAHAKVEPACLAQHHHAGVNQWPARAGRGQGFKMCRVPVVFTQAVVAAVHVLIFQLGL